MWNNKRSWTGLDKSLLDHIWSNMASRQGDAMVSIRSGSNHRLIHIDYWGIKKERGVNKRMMRKFSVDRFNKELEKVDWGEMYTMDNVNGAVSSLMEKLTAILDIQLPSRKIQMRKHYAKLLSEDTLTAMESCDRLRQKAEDTEQEVD